MPDRSVTVTSSPGKKLLVKCKRRSALLVVIAQARRPVREASTINRLETVEAISPALKVMSRSVFVGALKALRAGTLEVTYRRFTARMVAVAVAEFVRPSEAR